jgi:hypothetical protein
VPRTGRIARHAHPLDIERDTEPRAKGAARVHPRIGVGAQPVMDVQRGDRGPGLLRAARNQVEEDDGIEPTGKADADRFARADDATEALGDMALELHTLTRQLP